MKLITTFILSLSLLIGVASAEEQKNIPDVHPMKGKFETVKSKVKKVFTATDQGAKYQAYQVEWNDSEIVVVDQMGYSNKKVGDELTFMAQRIELPQYDGKSQKAILQFMIMDIEGFMNQEKE